MAAMVGWEQILKYCPHVPWPKQALALSIDCEELLYGGSAGPGKTEWLLMAALQYVDCPDYSALILRRDYARLSLSGAIMDRAKSWLLPRGVNWNEQQKTFTFASGATIQFGYIDSPNDRFRYASAEYQFIGWDELTEFRLPADEDNPSEDNPYLFLFSRLRRTKDSDIPLRFRAASNPGNIGHEFVKNRFITDESIASIGDPTPRAYWVDARRAFIPALIRDNPAIDEQEYVAKLWHLPKVTRQRLIEGDWTIREDSIINQAWFRRYSLQGEILREVRDDKAYNAIDARLCTRLATIDTAGTSKEKAEEKKGKKASWSTMGIWDYDATSHRLFLRYMWRYRVSWNSLKNRIIYYTGVWNPAAIYIENAHFGPALKEELNKSNVHLVGPVLPTQKGAGTNGGAKLERAVASGLLNMLEEGRIFLPIEAEWLAAYEAELVSWTGLDEEPADQIDVSSYAAYCCKKKKKQTWGGVIKF